MISVAAATNAAPPAHTRLRRSARREQLAAATDVATLTETAEQALAEVDELQEKLRDAEDAREFALLERDEALATVGELEEAKRLAAKETAAAFAEIAQEAETTGADERDEDVDPPRTVLEAVEQAEPQCPHLVFTESAFQSARDCPFEFPEDILEDLLKLERLAALWARPEGIGGMDLGQKASELGLHWKGGISETTTGGTKARQYEFNWNGQRIRMGPHTRRDRGQGAGRIARIYLYKHEPDDPKERRVVVAHVGRKLEDSTTA